MLPPRLCSSPSSGESAAPSLLYQRLLHSLVRSEHSINLFSMDQHSQHQGLRGQEAWANLTLTLAAEQCPDREQGSDASCRSSLTSHPPQLRLPKQREFEGLHTLRIAAQRGKVDVRRDSKTTAPKAAPSQSITDTPNHRRGIGQAAISPVRVLPRTY